MIIVEIIGGLGNQMFQYAFGRALSLKNNTDLKLDISAFDKYKLHNYNLNKFNIVENLADKNEVEGLKYNKYFWIKKKSKSYVEEPKFNFSKELLELPENVYLKGYFQSEKYFLPIRETLLQDFMPKGALSTKNNEMLEKITSSNSVSLHVRRGDYANNANTMKVHGLCSLDYYQKAVDYISSKVDNPHFFLFSDDPEWVKGNLKLDYLTTIVDINSGDDGIFDMNLMKNCKHNIIANSSFSWWGAWLNQNMQKIVIAPEKWFNDSPLDTKDVVPENWVKL